MPPDSRRLWLVLWQDALADPTGVIQSVLVEQCRRLPVSQGFTNVGLLLFDISGCRPLDRLAEPDVALRVTFQALSRSRGTGSCRPARRGRSICGGKL